MIGDLSDLLRMSFENLEVQEISLKQELEFLKKYLEIEQMRFQDRLCVEMKISPDTLDASVPNMILQPLVENAIKHGLAQRVEGGEIRVAVASENSALCLSVYNDGSSFAANWRSNGAGVGLANLRTRLRIMHGDAADLLVRNVNGGGVEVIVTLPLAAAA